MANKWNVHLYEHIIKIPELCGYYKDNFPLYPNIINPAICSLSTLFSHTTPIRRNHRTQNCGCGCIIHVKQHWVEYLSA